MPDQKNIDKLGGTMRLGKYPCFLNRSSKSFEAYRTDHISERHRHRYEMNNAYVEQLESLGMAFVGRSPDDKLCEIVEIPSHKWFVGVQFHPEFQSRPNRPHPLFRDFIKHSLMKDEPGDANA